MQDNATDSSSAPLLARLAVLVYESLLLTAVIFVASFLVMPVVGDLQARWQRHFFQVYILGVVFAYFAAFWLRSGQTLAMKTWRIRLVTRAGTTISFRQAVFRFVLAVVGLLALGAGFWWAFFDRDRQFLHDRLVGTRLVRVPKPNSAR